MQVCHFAFNGQRQIDYERGHAETPRPAATLTVFTGHSMMDGIMEMNHGTVRILLDITSGCKTDSGRQVHRRLVESLIDCPHSRIIEVQDTT